MSDPDAPLRLLHNVDRPIADQLVEEARRRGGARRLLIASPYFGGVGAVLDLARALGVDRVEVHVPNDVAVAGQCFNFAAGLMATPVVVSPLATPGDARPLHGKLIEIECADAVLTLTGSINASRPALAQTGNIELGVLRVGVEHMAVEQFTGDLPVFEPPPQSEGSTAPAILTATLVGNRLDGRLLALGSSGHWDARLDAVGEFRDLGEVEVDGTGAFSVPVEAGDVVGYGTRRAVLTLSRGSARARGFVTFPDLMELSRRFGTGVVGLLRVVGGSEEDDDLAGLLEYLASHPDETVGAWQGSSNRSAPVDRPDGRVVALSDLDVRPRVEGAADHAAGHAAGVVERLLRAFRGTARAGATGGGWTSAAEEDDTASGTTQRDRPPDRTDGVFASLCQILEDHVPKNPAAELARLGEIGVMVLARRPDAARLAGFAQWWSSLAVDHLRGAGDDPDLSKLAAAFVLIEALPAGSAARARRRLAMTVGKVDGALDELFAGSGRLQKLIDVGGPGMTTLTAFADRVRSEVSTYEELPVLIRAIRAGVEPPPLTRLDREPETAAVRAAIRAGKAHRLPIARPGATSCPNNNVRFAAAEIERLRAVGMVVARNCCSRVVVVDPDFDA